MDNKLEIDGFEWDKGNLIKSFTKHGVTFLEAEEAFWNEPLLYFPDEKHSFTEKRLIAFGKTNKKRLLTIAFTLRIKGPTTLIRVISARPMHRKEKIIYEKTISET